MSSSPKRPSKRPARPPAGGARTGGSGGGARGSGGRTGGSGARTGGSGARTGGSAAGRGRGKISRPAKTTRAGEPKSPRRTDPARAPRVPPSKTSGSGGVRLQKVLAAAGVASRRAAEEMIAAGRVAVNGEVVRTQGRRVDPATDRIEVDGARIATDPAYDYLVLNKPAGVVTTARDPQGRPTVVDLVESEQRVYPVGRLDVDTSGLVLMTNHGELAHRLAHPRYGIERVYRAKVTGRPADTVLRALTGGVELEDGPARALAVRLIGAGARESQLEMVMGEGRKREVRRMLEAVGHPVLELARIAFGPLKLGRLAVGGSRRLRPPEVGELLRSVGL